MEDTSLQSKRFKVLEFVVVCDSRDKFFEAIEEITYWLENQQVETYINMEDEDKQIYARTSNVSIGFERIKQKYGIK